MAEHRISGRAVQKHDTEANWNKATNFIPMKGEVIVYDPDATYAYPRQKIGDGSRTVVKLPFVGDALTVDLVNEQIQTYVDESILGGAW